MKKSSKKTRKKAPARKKTSAPKTRSSEKKTKFNVQIARNAMTPRVHDDGRPLHKGPYLPVLGACNVCTARCCRLQVKISLPDAIDFCRTLGLPFFSAISIIPASGAQRSFDLLEDPRIETRLSDFKGKAELALKRKDDGSCRFLMNIDGFERCGVYGLRPSTCRLYPFTWDSDVARGGPHVVLCPVPYGVTADEERRFLEDAERSIERWQIHDEVLELWKNHEPQEGRTVDAFLEFAINATAQRMGVDPLPVFDQRPSEARMIDSMMYAGVFGRKGW